ncbi:hypothetical protein DFJ73DRAFT_962474 [Zopfochytrium polystomum]|nr:hypothetical protein DFJ73DRAFT_962474 [Zopfochytrium polystomum]
MFSGNVQFARFLLASCSAAATAAAGDDPPTAGCAEPLNCGWRGQHVPAPSPPSSAWVGFLRLLIPFIRKEPSVSDALDSPNWRNLTPHDVAPNDEARSCFLVDDSIQDSSSTRGQNLNIIDTPGLIDTEEGKNKNSDAIGDNHMRKCDFPVSKEIRGAIEYYSRTFGKDPSLFHVVLGNFVMDKRLEVIATDQDLSERGFDLLDRLGLPRECSFYFMDVVPSPLMYTKLKLVVHKNEFFANETVHQLIERIREKAKTRSLYRQDLIFYKTQRMLELDERVIDRLQSHCEGFTKGVAVNNALLEEVIRSISEKSSEVTSEKLTIGNIQAELGEKDNDGDREIESLNHDRGWAVLGHRHTFNYKVPSATPISRVKLHRGPYNYWEKVSLDSTPVAVGGWSNPETWDIPVNADDDAEGREAAASTPVRLTATACSYLFTGISVSAQVYTRNRLFFANDIRELRVRLEAGQRALGQVEKELEARVNDRRVKESHMEECAEMLRRIGVIKAFLSEPHVRMAGAAFDCLQAIYVRREKTTVEDIAVLHDMVQAAMAL